MCTLCMSWPLCWLIYTLQMVYENLYQHCLNKVIIRGVLGKIIIKSSKYSWLLTIGCRRYAPTVKVSSEGYLSECFSSEPGDVNLKQPIYIVSLFRKFYEPSVRICSITCRYQKIIWKFKNPVAVFHRRRTWHTSHKKLFISTCRCSVTTRETMYNIIWLR